MLKIILVVIVVLIAIVAIIYIYYGGLSKVEVKEEMQGGEVLVYEEVIGDYAQTGNIRIKYIMSCLIMKEFQRIKGLESFMIIHSK
ncbi:hypothetical protein [Dysgonomonas sp. HGC4]|nr:hypothetical protein [Dysgonomonas sp. HGC4]MBD8349780.1 hypothetical protein [Dysgonomonas sp. HGC4]